MMALTDNLVSYWKLDDSSGNAADSVGANTLTNNNTVTYSAGKIGNGANFGAGNTTKSLTATSLTFNSYPLTIAGWFNSSTVNNDGNIFSFALAASPDYYQLRLRTADSKIVFRSNNTTQAADVDTGIVASTSTWYHFAVVINSTTSVTIYINGTATNTNTAIFVAAGLNKFGLGCLARTAPLQFYSGLIDEVGLWSRAITSDEVTSLYASGKGNQYPFSYPITLDASTNLGSTAGTTLTAAHTCSGNDRILFVHIRTAGTTDTVSSVTYAGSNMTLVDKKFGITNLGTYLYYLIAPTTGSNNVVINTTVAAISAIAVSYTGAKQSGQPDAHNNNESASTTGLSTSITVVATNSWAIMGVDSANGNDAAGTNATLRQAGPNTGVTVFDSNGPVGTGTFTMGFTCDLGSANCVLASFAPATTQTLVLPATQAAFALTGEDASFSYGRIMAAAVSSFLMTGQTILFALRSWLHPDRTNTTWADPNKSSTPVWTKPDRNNTSWDDRPKS